MKRELSLLTILAAILFAVPVNAQSGEPSNSYVLDRLNWLDESQEQEINTIARQLDLEGKAQIYVATMDDCGSDKTQYRSDIFNTWKIGAQKSDGGLLILVCWYGGDQSQRSVEVKTDKKMQRVIPDAVTATTAKNNFVPAFNENRPGAGLVKMVMVFDDVIRGKNSVTTSSASTSQSVTTSSASTSQTEWEPIIMILLLIIILPTILLFMQKNTSGGTSGDTSGGSSDDTSDRGGGGDGGGGGGSSTNF